MDPVRCCNLLRTRFGFCAILSVGPSKDREAQFSFTPASHDTYFASSSTSASTTSSAYSTSASTSSSYVYDVFINHRGADSKKSFASYLYYRLTNHGYRVFLDNQEMQGGDKLTAQIEGAIQTASVHIAIFSPGYADSVWCLKELVLMLESGSTILPVFYDIHPSHLRWARGVYGLALSKLEQKTVSDSQTNKKKTRYDSNTIDKWRKALSNVAEISGFELEACNRNEGQLAEKVVQQVFEKARKTHLNVAKYPIGLDDKVEDFERTVLLQRQSEETRVIAIVGPGGIGKTTLAKKVFNIYLSNYKRSCFLPDVRENPLISSQNKILRDLAGVDRKIEYEASGIEEIKKHLQLPDPVLMILDDVDHLDQLNALFAPVRDTVHSGSFILITSRNKDVLASEGIVESCIYNQTGLNHQHARELFCKHAFALPNPEIGFEQVVEDFLDSCHGSPLSLKVLGALLRGKDLEYWKAQFRKLSRILPNDILTRLKTSYDALDAEEKQLFLDISCFFIGDKTDTVIRIWDASEWEGTLGLANLENRCLLEVDSENRIKMHNHLRDMGRYLAQEELQEGLRLWQTPKNPQLSSQSPVRGISMVGKYGWKWQEQSFGKLDMSSLQLLRAQGYCVESVLTAGQSPQLVWLHWYDCPYSSLPSWIPVQNLTVLHIEGEGLTSLWLHESEATLQLRELNINAGGRFKIPKSIGNLKHLQKIVLCKVDVEALPEEFCNLLSLEHVEINYSKIKSLPQSFGKLTNLQCIRLSGCSNLEMLPESFGDLRDLERIHLSLCKLKMLPKSFGNLTNLQHINLSRCFMLEMLSDSFGNFSNLQDIDLSWSRKLKTLPESFGNLKNLQHIDLEGCLDLQTLPDIFGNLTNIRHIDLSWCKKLKRPHSLENLIERSLEKKEAQSQI